MRKSLCSIKRKNLIFCPFADAEFLSFPVYEINSAVLYCFNFQMKSWSCFFNKIKKAMAIQTVAGNPEPRPSGSIANPKIIPPDTSV